MEEEYVKLTNNIDLNGKEWIPIEDFSGYFNGNNNTIFNINVSNAEYAGLFGYLCGEIKNLTINGGSVSGSRAGALCGWIENWTSYACIYNVKNIGVSVSGTKDAGGIIGGSESDVIIENCENTGIVSSPTGDAGGIVGIDYLGTEVSNCVNRGNVTGKYACGIVGKGYHLTVENCTNYGNVHGTTIADAIAIPTHSLEDITITNCTNAGTITVDAGGTITNNGNVTM